MAVVNPQLNTCLYKGIYLHFLILELSSIFKECCFEMKGFKNLSFIVLACVKFNWGWVWGIFFLFLFLNPYLKSHPFGLRVFPEFSCPWAGLALNLRPHSVLH